MKKSKLALAVLLTVSLVFTMMPMTAHAAPAKVKITWNANGGKIESAKTKAISYTKGAKIKKLQTAKRTGYTLKGWYTVKSGGTKITKNTKATKKTTFYAQWTAKQYTLKYDANGGSVTPTSKKVAYKKAYGDLPTPTLEGHTFQGWYTAKSGGTKVSAKTKMPAKNITVYAQWKASRILSADEKELVGEYIYMSGSAGFWYDRFYDYYEGIWTDLGSYAGTYSYFESIEFCADGTYKAFFVHMGGSATRGGSYGVSTANWSVTTKGVLVLLNYARDIHYKDGTRLQWEDPDRPTDEYTLETVDGKQGIRFSSSSSWFYEKRVT